MFIQADIGQFVIVMSSIGMGYTISCYMPTDNGLQFCIRVIWQNLCINVFLAFRIPKMIVFPYIPHPLLPQTRFCCTQK